jgi:hypothetical protein
MQARRDRSTYRRWIGSDARRPTNSHRPGARTDARGRVRYHVDPARYHRWIRYASSTRPRQIARAYPALAALNITHNIVGSSPKSVRRRHGLNAEAHRAPRLFYSGRQTRERRPRADANGDVHHGTSLGLKAHTVVKVEPQEGARPRGMRFHRRLSDRLQKAGPPPGAPPGAVVPRARPSWMSKTARHSAISSA